MAGIGSGEAGEPTMPLGRPLLDTLDRMGCGGLVLDTAGEVGQINDTARRLLAEHAGQGPPDWRRALKGLLRSEAAARFSMDEDAWGVVRRGGPHRRSLVLHAVPLAPTTPSGPHTVVILVDLDAVPRPSPEALHKIFGLT